MSGSKDSAQGSIASGNVPRPERIVEPQDDDYTSSSGSDTDSDDSPSEDDEASPEPNGRSSIPSSSTIPTIRTQPRPNIGAFKDLAGASDLRARLSSFLPKLKEANAQLEGEDEEALKKRRIEIFAVEDKEDEDEMDGVEHEEEQVENDGKQYIEMNLGLGVLEHQDETKNDDSDERMDGTEDPLSKLMGQKAESAKKNKKPEIREIEEKS